LLNKSKDTSFYLEYFIFTKNPKMKNFLFLSVLLFSQCVFGQFARPRVISACELCNPRYLHMVDFDYDGDKDILTTSISDNKVVWYRNEGGGSFSSQLLITRDIAGPLQASSADFDGDQDMDVIAVSSTEKGLAWYKNDGKFNFSEKTIIDSSITRPQSVAVADFDGDKYPDVLVSAATFPERTVWCQNDGKGNFSKPKLIVSTYTGHLHHADLDSDGDQDVLISPYWYANDGKGNFTEMTQGIFSRNILYATSADLNNDKRLDIITFAAGYIYWHKNEGNGQFSNPTIIEFITSPQFAVGDIDGNGSPDIAFGFNSSNGTVLRWSKNDGQGNFTISEPVAANELTALQAIDVDNDQRLDLLGVSMEGGEINLYRNNPDLSFTKRAVVKNLVNGPRAVHSGDFDNDGHIDVLVASTSDNEVSWFKNDGKKGFAEQRIVTSNLFGANSVNVGDFDKDGDLDVVAGGKEAVYWYNNNGSGVFTQASLLFFGGPNVWQDTKLSVGDLDQDGNLDIFYMGLGAQDDRLYWHKNDGQGNFGAPKFLANAYIRHAVPSRFWAADMDNDKDLDMVVQTPLESDLLSWLSNDGKGNFTPLGPTGYVAQVNTLGGVLAADFDGDKDLDVLSESTLYWHENGGNGRFFDPVNRRFAGKHLIAEQTQGARFANIGDVDQDGDQDVIVATDKDRRLVWYRNNSKGVFSKPIPIAIGTEEARPMHLVDLDKDGDLDIITFHEFSDKVLWYENIESLPTIEGLVFLDKNSNGKQEDDEQILASIPVTLSPEALSSYTDFDGKFRFFAPNRQYQLSVQAGACWESTTGSLTRSILINNNVVDTLMFGLKVKGQDPRPEASLHAGPTRCSFEVPFWLTVQNTGCGLSKGRYAVVLSPLVKLISTNSTPAEVRGDTLFWDYADLVTSQSAQVSFVLQVAGTEFIGDSIRLKALAWLEKSPGVFEGPRISNFSSEIRCAYDPNDKLVLPNRAPRYTQNYTLFNETLEYTIRFQNTGNDTAFTVVIRDTLAQNLDWRTFQMGASSHPVETQLTEGGVLKFTFRNILLPDSTTNEQGSHGFVSFRIAPKTGLPEKTPLLNSASIYFDFNPPIKTNTTNSVMVSVLPKSTRTESVQVHSPFLLFPNPFYDRLHIRAISSDRNLDGHYLQLWNGQGQLVFTQPIAGKIADIGLPNLAAGLYFYVLIDQDAKAVGSGKIVRR